MLLPDLINSFANFFAWLNQILTATIVITALSLLMYSLTFNLHDRAARSFSTVLFAISVVFVGDSFAAISTRPETIESWLRFQWLGIAFMPTAYFHFSDAMLATTGLLSRGRRYVAVRIGYLLSAIFFIVAAFTDWLVFDPTVEGRAQHLQAGAVFYLFTILFALASIVAWFNLYRAYRRCLTASTRRRAAYLLIASIALPISVFPYLLLVGGSTPSLHPLIFWWFSVLGNLIIGAMITLMAYVVAFFGTAQPDRVIKSRLFQHLLRGPFVASIVLGIMVIAGRAARALGNDESQVVAVAAIGTLILLQYVITLVRIPLERRLFYGGLKDRSDVLRIQTLGERLLTADDTHEFLESVAAAACDLLRVRSAFVAAVESDGARVEAKIGLDDPPEDSHALTLAALQNGASAAIQSGLFVWDDYWVLPLRSGIESEVIGLLALKARSDQPDLTHEEARTLQALADRAAAALEDRRAQRKLFSTVETLLPHVERLQKLRAASRYASANVIKPEPNVDAGLIQSVREALSQYWGGPKLINSPLLQLKVVERALQDHDGNAANALRAVLHDAIERVKPEGQRKFTAEWIIYNILEMKFMQGRRVREVALRLSVSEADLYRKQRVAIEQVARMIATMEREIEGVDEDEYTIAG